MWQLASISRLIQQALDRYEISEPSACEQCGSKDLSEIIGDRKQQVATLAARPIEVVEYQRAKCQCLECGAETGLTRFVSCEI